MVSAHGEQQHLFRMRPSGGPSRVQITGQSQRAKAKVESKVKADRVDMVIRGAELSSRLSLRCP